MSCCAVHSAVGWAVTAKWTGRRRSCDSTMKTKSIRNVEVGTTKKSVDTKSFMWFFRKVFQVWDGGLRLWTMYLATVDWEIAIPSLSNSPWRRGAPQRGLARLISRIRSRVSLETGGRPFRTRLFKVQYSRKPFRFQAMTVSGFTISRVQRQPGQRRESPTQSTRSAALSWSRWCGFSRCRTRSRWRRAKISAYSAARIRKDLRKDKNSEKTMGIIASADLNARA